MTTLPERGRLEETPLPQLLLALLRDRFDGALRLSRGRTEKTFLFLQGVPVYAESNLASESLACQLLEAEKIERRDYERVVAYASRERCKEGKALLELSLLDTRGLFAALKQQIRLRLIECFAWPDGEYQLDPGAAPSPEARALRCDPLPLVQEGVATHWSLERLLHELRSALERHAALGPTAPELAARLAPDEALAALLERLDGRTTLWRALGGTPSPRLLAALWVLEAAGGLELSDAPRAEGDVDSAVQLFVAHDDRARAASPSTARSAAPRGAAAGVAGAPPSERAEALRREIEAKFKRLEEIDHYRLLGELPSAAPAAIKAAYHRAAKTYHPDALARAGLDEETRRCATRVFAAISAAHAVLSDPERRRHYDAALAGDTADLDADRLASAETNFRKGEILVRQGNFRGAIDYLRAAVELWPEEAEYQALLGWALFKKTPSDPKAAREHLARAVEIDPRNESAQAQLAAVLRALEVEA